MRALLILTLALLSACQTQPLLAPLPAWQSPEGREHLDAGRIRDLRSGQDLTPEQLVERLAGAPRVLVGERHDNPDHHALQLWLLRALESRRAQGSLLLEMLEPAQKPKLDAARQAIAAGELPTDLPVALGWQRGWDWSLYGAIVRHALAQPFPLLPANLDRGEIMDVYRERPVLSGTASTAESVREALLAQIRASHCGKLPEDQLPAMLAVQQQRDRRMADVLRTAPRPAMLLAGAYHVRRDLGVPLHLADLGSGEAAVLILAEVGSEVATQEADFVWYTPAMPEEDFCARFGQRE